MSPSEKIMFDKWREMCDLSVSAAILEWDQETYMPKKGQAGRGQVLATLAGLRHRLLTDQALSDAVATTAEAAPADSDLAAQCKAANRYINRASRVSEKLTKELAAATSAGLAAWQKARAASDFSLFSDELARIVDLRREQAAAIDPTAPAYDVLMDEYEPGATQAMLAPVFEELCAELSPLIKAVADCCFIVDEAPAMGEFPEAAQASFGQEMATAMGFDFDAGRLDLTTHPFCTGFQNQDVRITWRYMEDDFRSALYGIMHEAGHGLYEQGLPDKWQGTPIGGAVSLGMHESQSRLWENLVGRSQSFWEWALPKAKQYFPCMQNVSNEQLWPALHTARPSFIRVEADEATYNLHIAIRFDIERWLFAGELETCDLPEAWNQAYQKYLGITPSNASEGVLQDIHWAMGAFGYFPTYSLGNLISCQLFACANEELGDLNAQFRNGEFANLRNWLGEKVHSQASRYSANELVERITGRPLAADDFLNYIKDVTVKAYRLANISS